MNKQFWQKKWEDRQIGFHASNANTFLIAYCSKLALNKGDRIYLPLCGKTLDIAWLLERNFCIVGVELVQTAIEQLFEELQLTPAIEDAGQLLRYSATNIEVYAGDVFALTENIIGPVQAIYDRAALVALPPDMRNLYAEHLIQSTRGAQQLLITYTYNQEDMAGPPFSISEDEVFRHYGRKYAPILLERKEVPGGLKGSGKVWEQAWLLK